jgi:hypothetical protein
MANAAEIAEQLGLTPTGKGGYTGFCPSCCYETGFSVIDKDGKTLFHCHAGGCSQQDIIKWLREYGLWGLQPCKAAQRPMERPAPTSKADTTEAALEMWQRSAPAAGTVVETYLRARGYFGPIPRSLRYVRGKHPADDDFHPAMLAAALRFGETPTIVGVHRTFLQPDGSGKTSLRPGKMSLGDIGGAGVPLSLLPEETVAVSEGIETGLSVQQATGIRTIAALSAAGVQALLLPDCVREVFIAADHDDVGLKGAYSAARRWHGEGRIVRIVKPPEGVDFNDLARSAG